MEIKIVCSVCGKEAYKDYINKIEYVFCKDKECSAWGKGVVLSSNNIVNKKMKD